MNHGLRASARGISLIEVLVSLVILSLGVLAVVALQMIAKRNNADAGQRTVAAQLAYDMIERMRANSTPTSLLNYQTGSAPLGRASLGTTAPTPNCGTSDGSVQCTEPQLVAYDMWTFERALDGASEQAGGSNAGGLVSPTACITGPSAGGDGTYTVTIVWRGTVELPPDATVTCGLDPQADGTLLYSKGATADNLFRRAVSMPVYITARRRTS